MQMNAQNNEVKIPEYFSPTLKDLVLKLLDKDPTKRPTATEALTHEFFQ